MANQNISGLPNPSTVSNSDIFPFTKVATSITSGINYITLASVLNDNTQLTGYTDIDRSSINSASIANATLYRPVLSAPSVIGDANFANDIYSLGEIRILGAASALGYGTGAGGVVVQSVGGRKEISVSLNRATGKIIMSNSVMAASVLTSVLFGNSVMGVTDHLALNYIGNGLSATSKRYYILSSSMVSPGAAVIDVKSGNNFTDASSIFIGFTVIKGAIS